MKKTLLYAILLILFLATGIYLWLTNANNYRACGEFALTVNEKPIQIIRDANGTAYVFAENKADAIRGQGFVIAQDRLFQIEFYRAFINGELAEILGPSMLRSDIKMRVLGIPQNAAKNFPLLDQNAKDFLQWYSEGFNEYLKVGKAEFPIELSLLNIEPTPISPLELLSVVHFIGFNHAQNMGDEILSLNLAAGMEKAKELLPLNLNPDRTKKLHFYPDSLIQEGSGLSYLPPVPETKTLLPAPKLGSNNWAVAGSKTQSGKPILSNDPHLDARLFPGIFYPIGLFCPEFRSIGAALPGIPGLMVGRNEKVAFGVTNAYGDSQDLFIEQTDGEKYFHGGEWLNFEKRKETIKIKNGEDLNIEVRSTVRGPILSDFEAFGIGTKDVLSFRWSQASSQSKSLGIEQFLEAQNVAEFRQTLAGMDNMFFNFIIADVHGNIAHQSTGLIPTRANHAGGVPQSVQTEDSWTGYIPKNELPHMINPERGWVGTANHDTRPDDYPYYYSSHFSPDYRYKRIGEVLSQNKKFDAEDMWQLILDCKNKQAEAVVPVFIKGLEGEERVKHLADILKNWNYLDDINETGATIYHVLYDELLNLILDDELPDQLEKSFWGNRYYWSQNLQSMILEGHAFIDNTHTPEKETLQQLIIEAGEKTIHRLTDYLGPDTEDWTWGNIHPVHFVSPIRPDGWGHSLLGAELFPKKGSNQTINRGGYGKSRERPDFETGWFSSFRMVADLNDDEKIRAVLSGGSAARVFHPYYKVQLDTWKKEEWIPYWFSKKKIMEHKEHELVLK